MSLLKNAVHSRISYALTAILVLALPTLVNASAVGYLTNTNGSVVTNGKGECWATKNSSSVDLPEACGGKAPEVVEEKVPAPIIDTDGDGVPDDADQCPNTPAGVEVYANGCPKDTDGDGVYDYKDKCPGTPLGDTVDADGCSISLTLSGDVLFDTDSSVIKPAAFSVLDDLYSQLSSVGITQLNVIGHADSRGAESYNQALSERRANAVREYLINKGMSSSSITASGSGELYPVGDNSTKEGRRLNRRVEFEVVE